MIGPSGDWSIALGQRNEVPPQTYEFKTVKCTVNGGKFSTVMIQGCNKLGPDCRNDVNSIYLGQDHHMGAEKFF